MSLEFLRLGHEALGARGAKPKFILFLTLISFLFHLLKTLVSLDLNVTVIRLYYISLVSEH